MFNFFISHIKLPFIIHLRYRYCIFLYRIWRMYAFLVCPGETKSALTLNKFRDRMVCPKFSLHCTNETNEIVNSFGRAFERTVFMIHYNQSPLMSLISAQLSKCNLNTVIINVAHYSFNRLPMCSADYNAVVITFTPVGLSFIQVASFLF